MPIIPEGRGVSQSHPTNMSQGFDRLALLRFGLEPAKTSFEVTPEVTLTVG
ncbi:hypothetical protein VDG1235_4477 [Verrucomicrobiia bacterium DG1235]|nr:hypothetical protein VDG1235_4477 [Verrucomicrobiae bacterium DG1235]